MDKNTLLRVGLTIIAGVVGIAILTVVLQQKPKPASQKMQVVVSFYPLYFLAHEIGGVYTDVVNITPPGVEPHDFEPTARDIAQVQGADIVILNGGGLESYERSVTELVRGTNTSLMVVLDGAHAGSDPHTWLDPVAYAKIADRIGTIYLTKDPVHASYYHDRLAALRKKLISLDADMRSQFAECSTRTFVTSHSAFAFLAKRYNLTQLHIAGISPEDEPNPKSMSFVANYVQKNGISTVFFEELVSPKLSETIAREAGAKTDVLSPIEGLTPEQQKAGKTYLDLQRQNMVKLAQALGCRPL
jgi:zinc transport system substrate-binding protein